MWDLPIAVEIDGESHKIRNKCDYRVILDVICALNDNELSDEEKAQCALFIFYENVTKITNYEKAFSEMVRIINVGEVEGEESNKPQLMDWEHDFQQLAPPISRVLGYSVRDSERYTHWYDFVGAYMEIGECTWATVVSIRKKKTTGKKLEKWEQKFYRDNKKMVDLPRKLTAEELEYLDSDW